MPDRDELARLGPGGDYRVALTPDSDTADLVQHLNLLILILVLLALAAGVLALYASRAPDPGTPAPGMAPSSIRHSDFDIRTSDLPRPVPQQPG